MLVLLVRFVEMMIEYELDPNSFKRALKRSEDIKRRQVNILKKKAYIY